MEILTKSIIRPKKKAIPYRFQLSPFNKTKTQPRRPHISVKTGCDFSLAVYIYAVFLYILTLGYKYLFIVVVGN